MTNMQLAHLANVSGGKLVGQDCAFTSVSIDTRTLKPGALFVALSGPNFDGHDFVSAAVDGQAAAADDLVVRRGEQGVRAAVPLR